MQFTEILVFPCYAPFIRLILYLDEVFSVWLVVGSLTDHSLVDTNLQVGYFQTKLLLLDDVLLLFDFAGVDVLQKYLICDIFLAMQALKVNGGLEDALVLFKFFQLFLQHFIFCFDFVDCRLKVAVGFY